jgi:hypothetical protein
MTLIIGKDYYILHFDIQFKGKYKTFYSNEHCSYYSFVDVEMRSIDLDSKFGHLTYKTIHFLHYVFTDIDIFYDIEEMRNNKIKSQQNMEQRSLDIILKRLVNENFQW